MEKEKYKMNIAMLGHKRIPSREGGIEIVVEELSTRMVMLGHSVTCLNRGGQPLQGQKQALSRKKEYKGVKIRSVLTWDRKGLAAVTASITGAIIATLGKYDVVHFHAEGPCVMMWLPKMLGKRCVATIHGLDYQRAKWGKLASTYILLGEKCAVKYADEIIVLSESNQKYFWDTYHRMTRFIPNGVNEPQVRQACIITEKYGLLGEDYLFFSGRLVPEKGIQYMIDAFKRVKTDKKLVIAGGSSDTSNYVKELIERASDDKRIKFIGFVQGQELEELYSNAYVYILPSDLEGMSLSLLEAMSYGNCCLVSDIAECTEVVEDKAVIFKKGCVESLKTELQRLCDSDRVVKQYKETASDFICKKYNWDVTVEETLKLYKG